MIHILLLILKIIGIILLSVIGLLLLAVLSVLFVPVRYKAKGDYHKEFTGKLHVGWFLNALSLDASFDKELKARARVLFFTLYDSDKNKMRQRLGKATIHLIHIALAIRIEIKIKKKMSLMI